MPPYEHQLRDSREKREAGAWNGRENKDNIGNLWTKEVEATPEIIEQIQKLKSENKGKSETYLEAMLKVYSGMFAVLKSGGLAIIVVKAFIRNKKCVDLPWHSWLLLQRVGFQLVKLYKLRLETPSFWRILFYNKHPEVPRINHEYVLVCQKPGGSNHIEPAVDHKEYDLLSKVEEARVKIAKKLVKEIMT